MKTPSTFKLSKTTKRALSLGRFTSEDHRHAWKRAMISAEVAASVRPKSVKGDKQVS